MTTFNLFVPTRGRPANVGRLLASIRTTAAHPDRLNVSFYVDDDDAAMLPAIQGYKAEYADLGVQFAVGPRVLLSDCYNALFAKTEFGDILWSGGDDIIFRTEGWDQVVADRFALAEDEILLVYGDDYLQHERLATHPFLSRTGVSVVGYFFPVIDGLSPTDIWVHRMYEAVGRLVYEPGVVTEHMHPFRNKAPMDQTYQDQFAHNLKHVMDCANQHYGDTLRDAAKLRSFIHLQGRHHAISKDVRHSHSHARPPDPDGGRDAVAAGFGQ